MKPDIDKVKAAICYAQGSNHIMSDSRYSAVVDAAAAYVDLMEKLAPLIEAREKATKHKLTVDGMFMENDNEVRVCTDDGTETYYHRSATICECYKHDFYEERDCGEPFIDVLQAEANARFFALAANTIAEIGER